MRKFGLLFLLFFWLIPFFKAQSPLITHTHSRAQLSLNGQWRYIVDPYESGYYNYRQDVRDQLQDPGKSEALFLNHHTTDSSERIEYDFEKADRIQVPRDWNSQKEKLFYYEGTIWYYKAFDYEKAGKGGRQFLYFGAVNYEAHVYLNGKKVGSHIGGFSPFNFEVTDLLQPEGNFLIVKADNRRSREQVPTVNTDWWNYGGITRDVKILEVGKTFIQDSYVQLLKGDANTLEVEVQLNGPNKSQQKVLLEIAEAKLQLSLTTDDSGLARGVVRASELNYWSPENPHLYEVKWRYQGDSLMDRVGFRTIETRGANILLNGESVFLRGISIHEENPIRGGRANSKEDARMLLGWAKEMGCNYVRLAHYTHNEHMIRMADEIGLMVWSEVPVYWTIQWSNPATLQNAKDQLAAAITRDKNRASVIIWSVANETPISAARNVFLTQLIQLCRTMDRVRLVSCAMEKRHKEGTQNVQEIGDPLQELVDIISFNEYIGWYDGLPEKTQRVRFEIQYDKPVVISEFGAGALHGLHGAKGARWTEEFQEDLYIQTLQMLDSIPQLRGMTPWILADFRSPRRMLDGIQDGWNRKGLISEGGEKKKAFYVMQRYYAAKQGL